MSVEQKPAPAGISQADHEAAVTAAEGRGREQGAAQANARLSAALGAEGVRSDAGRMSAALDLALKAPAMSGEDVAGFVISSVPAAAKSEPAPEAYEQERLRAAGQAKPAQKTATQGGEDVAGRALANYCGVTGTAKHN